MAGWRGGRGVIGVGARAVGGELAAPWGFRATPQQRPTQQEATLEGLWTSIPSAGGVGSPHRTCPSARPQCTEAPIAGPGAPVPCGGQGLETHPRVAELPAWGWNSALAPELGYSSGTAAGRS